MFINPHIFISQKFWILSALQWESHILKVLLDLYEILCFLNGVVDGSDLVECYKVLIQNWTGKELKLLFLGCVTEDEDRVTLQNVGNFLPIDMV